MSDSTNNKKSTPSYIFENEFAYVTDEGNLFLKNTSYFEERKIASVDPEAVEEHLDSYQKKFDDLKNRIDKEVEKLGLGETVGSENVDETVEKLKSKILQSEAVGDFESLLKNLEKSISDLKKSTEEKEQSEPAEKEAQPEEKKEEIHDAGKSDDKSESGSENKKVKEAGKEDDPKQQLTEKSDVPDEDAEEVRTSLLDKLVSKAKDTLQLEDWAIASLELEKIEEEISSLAAGDEEENEFDESDIESAKKAVKVYSSELEEKKKEHYEEQKRLKAENLEKKKELLEKLQKIVDNKQWTHTNDVGKIKGKWDHIKPIDREENEKLQERYKELLKIFDSHKVDRLVKKKQQEEDNLTGKLVILEKMEAFAKTLGKNTDWKEADKEFDKLMRQFRKIGRVPVEKNQETWDRFHEAQDTFHSMRFKHDKKYRNEIEKNLVRKKKIIDEAEALIDMEDLAEAARQVNKLHRRWKKAGNLPQKEENELWDQFKAATDAFNEKKANNLDKLREKEEENYNEKLKLIEKAEEMKDSEDWEQTHSDYQKLMNKWKNAGPVPRKKSGKIWKKFKGAMDHFYDRRREYFKEVKEERKDNLKEKEDILTSLKELQGHENPVKAVELAKPLQEEFKKAGYVPIKHKNRLWKEYREICDVIYDRFRAAKSAIDVVGKENIEKFSTDDIADIRDKQQEADKLQKQIKKLSEEVIQRKESLSYFKPKGGSNPLLDDAKKKLEDTEATIEEKQKKLDEIEKEIDLLKRDA